MTRQGRERGFTLLETIVAFAIATSALTILYRIHAGATATIALGADHAFAAELAESLIAENGFTENARFERRGVEAEKFRWQISAGPVEQDGTQGLVKREDSFPIRRFDVVVSWGSGQKERRFELSTLRPVPRVTDAEPAP